MALFGRRKAKQVEPPERGLSGDAAAMRDALSSLSAQRGGTKQPDLQALVRDLLEGEVAAPTADVSKLIRLHTDPDDFYAKELKPSWEGLSEAQRAHRLEGFIDLASMLDSAGAGAGLPPEMGPSVRTKTLMLAWAFDETYGYLSRIARGETDSAPE